MFQSRLQAHVRNVQLFHELLGVQVDWITQGEDRLATLRRASKVFSYVQQQLESFQVRADLQQTCMYIHKENFSSAEEKKMVYLPTDRHISEY